MKTESVLATAMGSVNSLDGGLWSVVNYSTRHVGRLTRFMSTADTATTAQHFCSWCSDDVRTIGIPVSICQNQVAGGVATGAVLGRVGKVQGAPREWVSELQGNFFRKIIFPLQ